MERMLANSITHLTMHGLHDEHGPVQCLEGRPAIQRTRGRPVFEPCCVTQCFAP